MFSSSVDSLLRNSFLAQEALRQQQMYEGPFARMQRELSAREDLLKQITGSGIFSAIRTVDAVLDRQLRHVTSVRSIGADVSRSGPMAFEGLQRIQNAQSYWMENLSAELQRTSLASFATAIPKGFDIAGLVPQLEVAFQSAVVDYPGGLEAFEDFVPDVVREIADGVAHVIAGDPGVSHAGTVSSFVLDILKHYDVLDEKGRARLFFMISLILISFLGNAAAEIAGVEWGRFRDRNAPAEAQGPETDPDEQAQIRRLVELAEYPPRVAHVIRRAWLRASPSTNAPKLGPILDSGTSLMVYERKDGWIRVDIEPTPGDVRHGWVYGKLTQYD